MMRRRLQNAVTCVAAQAKLPALQRRDADTGFANEEHTFKALNFTRDGPSIQYDLYGSVQGGTVTRRCLKLALLWIENRV